MTGSTARDIVNEATRNAGRDRPARFAAGVLALCLLVAGIYFGPRLAALGEHLDQLQTSADRSNEAARALADQVMRLGGTPVVQPPPPASVSSTASVDPAEVRQAARTAVAEYCAAPTHPCRGSDGSTPPFDAIVDAVVAKIPTPKDGRDGRDAATPDYAALVAAYCGQAGEPCRGPAGERGEKGDPPPCMAEPSQCRGADGQPGPTCPPGYELHDAVFAAPDGTTYTGKACVDPASSAPPSTDPPLPFGGN